MNNTGKKILILGIVIAIAIAGILAFYPTIVAPPIYVPVNNLHKSSLEANINGFSDTENTIFKKYESSYREFQTILKKAQADFDRENPFACDDFKSKYISMIENMYYYTKYYNSDWNIRYLNEQIAEALERLKNHTDGKFADFSSLIDPNF